MLRELRIENLLVIERAELRLGEGLNAITGETGAGKTVLAHALDLLTGGRARDGIVRPGAEEAYVEGTFSAPEGLLDDPELESLRERLGGNRSELVLARRVQATGRTSAFVGHRSASAGDLRLLGSRLLAFWGQHEHRRLTLGSAQLEVLDGFAGAGHMELRASYREAHREVESLRRELGELRDREGARERDLDLLRFELSEIEAVGPDPSEEGELRTERDRLGHAEALRRAAAGALARIEGDESAPGAESLLAAAASELEGPGGFDPELDGLAERGRALALELADLGSSLRSYGEGLESEPSRLEAVSERLDAIERLKRKHGGTVEAVLEHGGHCREEIERLGGTAERAEQLEARLASAEERRAELSGRLGEGRGRAASELSERVAAELAQLAMEGATLEVELRPHPDGHGPSGAETVEMRLSTNPGMPVAPLRDAASGGELSRVMLALCGLGPAAGAPTMAFDEVDAGIGGNTARAVGERLRRLAADRQVLCITHLPQVASAASTHFRIRKRTEDGEARAEVERVRGEELVDEMVRMLGGERGDRAAEEHARRLLAA